VSKSALTSGSNSPSSAVDYVVAARVSRLARSPERCEGETHTRLTHSGAFRGDPRPPMSVQVQVLVLAGTTTVEVES
jgi:hypothetical protein